MDETKNVLNTIENIKEYDTLLLPIARLHFEGAQFQQKKDLYYLEELMNAIEKDDVFDFLIDSFEKAKEFQRKNLSFHEYSFLNSLIAFSRNSSFLTSIKLMLYAHTHTIYTAFDIYTPVVQPVWVFMSECVC